MSNEDDPLAVHFVHLSKRYGELEAENKRLRRLLGRIAEAALMAVLTDGEVDAIDASAAPPQ